jgi:hypothetical protein
LAIAAGEPAEILESKPGWTKVGGWGMALPTKKESANRSSKDNIHVEGWLPQEQTEPLNSELQVAGQDEDEAWARVYASGDLFHLPPPNLETEGSNYARFIDQNNLPIADRLLLILAICPHLAPELMDRLLVVKNESGERPMSEIGGVTPQAK